MRWSVRWSVEVECEVECGGGCGVVWSVDMEVESYNNCTSIIALLNNVFMSSSEMEWHDIFEIRILIGCNTVVGSNIVSGLDSGLDTWSGSGLGTWSGSGLGTWSGSGLDTWSGSGLGTWSDDGLGTWSGSGLGTCGVAIGAPR